MLVKLEREVVLWSVVIPGPQLTLIEVMLARSSRMAWSSSRRLDRKSTGRQCIEPGALKLTRIRMHQRFDLLHGEFYPPEDLGELGLDTVYPVLCLLQIGV